MKRTVMLVVALILVFSLAAVAAEQLYTIKHVVKLPTTKCAQCHKVDAEKGLVTIKSDITGKKVVTHLNASACAGCHQVKDKEVILKKEAKAEPVK